MAAADEANPRASFGAAERMLRRPKARYEVDDRIAPARALKTRALAAREDSKRCGRGPAMTFEQAVLRTQPTRRHPIAVTY